MPRVPRAIPSILCMALLATALPAAAAAPDWNAVKDVQTVQILTKDEDGSTRDTTIWLAVLDGQGYIRTGSTRWKANIERSPDVTLRIGETEYPLRAEFVTDAELQKRVEEVLHEKYGFSDSFIGIFRIGDPTIMRLVPR